MRSSRLGLTRGMVSSALSVAACLCVAQPTMGGRISQPWAMDNANPARTGKTAHNGPLNGVIDWKKKVAGRITGIACDLAGRAILGSTFYTPWWSNELYVQTYRADGEIDWRCKVTPYVWGGSQGVTSGPALNLRGQILLNSGNGEILKFDPRGSLTMTITRMTNAANDISPAWNADGTFIHHQIGTLTKFAANGSVIWNASGFTETDPAVAPNGDVAMGGVRTNEPHGSVDVSYYNANGTLRWSKNSTFGTRTQVCFGPDGTLYTTVSGTTAYNPNGSIKWNQPNGGWGVCLDGLGRALVPVGNTIRAFDRNNGTPIWQVTLPTQGMVVEGLTIDGANRIYLSTSDGYVYCLGSGGQILWSLLLGDSCTTQPAVGAGQSLFVGVGVSWSDNYLIRIKQG